MLKQDVTVETKQPKDAEGRKLFDCSCSRNQKPVLRCPLAHQKNRFWDGTTLFGLLSWHFIAFTG